MDQWQSRYLCHLTFLTSYIASLHEKANIKWQNRARYSYQGFEVASLISWREQVVWVHYRPVRGVLNFNGIHTMDRTATLSEQKQLHRTFRPLSTVYIC